MTTSYAPEQFPRRRLPEEVDLTTWEKIEPWYRDLLARTIGSPQELEDWLLDAGELNGAVSQEGVAHYVAMTCQTDDPKREQAHLEFVREIEPRLKPFWNEIRAKYLDSPHRLGLPIERYRVFDRAGKPPVALPRGEHPPRNRTLRAGTNVSKDHRRNDRQLPRPGIHPSANGGVSRGTRPRNTSRSLETRRRTALDRSR